MKKKKILFFHHCPTIGGAGISGLNTLLAIPKDKYDIVVFCNSEQRQMIDLFEKNGFHTLPGGKSPVILSHCVGSEKLALSFSALRNYFQIAKSRNRIDEVIQNEKPDIVIINTMTLCWIGKYAKRYGAKTICFFRETYVRGFLGIRTSYIKRCLDYYFDKIAFISEYEMKQSEKIHSHKEVIYNMVRPEGYDSIDKAAAKTKLGLKEDIFYILFVGGFNKIKGTMEVLKAMDVLKDENICLVFAGCNREIKKRDWSSCISLKQKIRYLTGKNYEDRCIDYIIDHHLQKKIFFYPHQENIALFYKACDLLCFPMTRPHQARPLFEAGYARIPVVITDFPNIKELADESNCYLFKNGDTAQLVNIIMKIKNHDKLVEVKTKKNYIDTINRHSETVFNQKINALLEFGEE